MRQHFSFPHPTSQPLEKVICDMHIFGQYLMINLCCKFHKTPLRKFIMKGKESAMKPLRGLRKEDGQSVVELAIIMPILIFIMMIMIYLGMFIFAKSVVLFSAHQGGREALNFRTAYMYTDDEKDEFIRTAVLSTLSNAPRGAAPPEIAIHRNADSGLIEIVVTYYFKLNLPFIKEVVGDNGIPIESDILYRLAPPNS